MSTNSTKKNTHKTEKKNQSSLLPTKKSNGETLLSNISKRKLPSHQIVLTIISVVAALVSAFSAVISNQHTRQANQIALDANKISSYGNILLEESIKQTLPDLYIEKRGNFYNYFQYTYPCVTDSGYAYWNKDLLVVFDIMNVGGRAVSLVEMPKNEDVETFVEGMKTQVSFSPFGMIEDFDNWMLDNGFDIMTFSLREDVILNRKIPLMVQPGEVKRIILLERITTTIDAGVKPEDVSVAVREFDWIAHPSFRFSDGTEIPVEIILWAPYIGTPIVGTNTPDFEYCIK